MTPPLWNYYIEWGVGPDGHLIEPPSIVQKLTTTEEMIMENVYLSAPVYTSAKETLMEKKPLVPLYVRTTVQTVKLPLSDTERLLYGKQLAEVHMQRQYALEKRKEEQDAWKTQIDAYDQSLKHASRALHSGLDEKPCEVEIRMDFNSCEVTTVLCATGKILALRPMTEEEKQIPLEAYLEQGGQLKMPDKEKMKAV